MPRGHFSFPLATYVLESGHNKLPRPPHNIGNNLLQTMVSPTNLPDNRGDTADDNNPFARHKSDKSVASTATKHPTDMSDVNHEEPPAAGTIQPDLNDLTPNRKKKFEQLQGMFHKAVNDLFNPSLTSRAPEPVTPFHTPANTNPFATREGKQPAMDAQTKPPGFDDDKSINTNHNNANNNTAAAAKQPATPSNDKNINNNATTTAKKGVGLTLEEEEEILTPPPRGISGVRKATTEMWEEQAAAGLSNAATYAAMARRVEEGRGDKTRPALYIKYRVPFPKIKMDEANNPTAGRVEFMADALIGAGNFPFKVDRVRATHSQTMASIRGVDHFHGAFAISPESFRAHDMDGFKYPVQDMAELDNTMFQLLRRKEDYRYYEGMPTPCGQNVILTVPNVNCAVETVGFVLGGIHPSTLLGSYMYDDVQSSRALGLDMVLSLIEQMGDEAANIDKLFRNRFDVGDVFSIKHMRNGNSKEEDY